ncbi:MAG: ABC transporter substrate-binding protein [Armatimonadetes bacterium]|nr:ABC transporter substrate-binding protein [Armatimonadota bacterium]
MPEQTLTIGHSPDPDDAFMFYALTHDRIDTAGYRFRHHIEDIESLNRRAQQGELEITACSLHAYAYLSGRYALLASGSSTGKGYGPILVAREPLGAPELAGRTIAVPGTLTTAFLTLRLFLPDFRHIVVPFDEILDTVAEGHAAAGLVIHEGQLTYVDQGLRKVADLGAWWLEETGLPLPLGVNVVRRDLGPEAVAVVARLLRQSIEYALSHRQECLDYSLRYGRGIDPDRADRFVGMYVNDYTRDFGQEGRAAVRELLGRAHRACIIPALPALDFVE